VPRSVSVTDPGAGTTSSVFVWLGKWLSLDSFCFSLLPARSAGGNFFGGDR
jgi:hypothetical protein